MFLPFLIAILFLLLCEVQLWAHKCPTISIDDIISDVLVDHHLNPENPDAPAWRLLNDGDIENWSKALLNTNASIERRDEYPKIRGDTLDLNDHPTAPPRIYCRYWLKEDVKMYDLVFYIDLEDWAKEDKVVEPESPPRIHTPSPPLPVIRRMYPNLLIPYSTRHIGVFGMLFAIHRQFAEK